ncbi:hypothetical protein E2C01_060231 [Portunus trituberculatus]|uniref:Uncharacterized protein n=1 Tax=Portunus trituberculatus TaxID=210409 RepID=A0A5B7HAT3_PORTR|nr:hypothetical protein [Portunus trituberculatus]
MSCRGGICSLDKRCQECEDWEDDVIIKANRHQVSLQSRRLAYHKGNEGDKSLPVLSPSSSESSASNPDVAPVPADDSASSDSPPPSPGPSVSQVNFSDNPQAQFSQALTVINNMAAFLGISGDDSHTRLKDVVKDMVRDSLADKLTSMISVPPVPPSSDVPLLFMSGGSVSTDVHLPTAVGEGRQPPPTNVVLENSLFQQEVCTLQPATPSCTPKRIPKDLKGKVKPSRTAAMGDDREVMPSTTHSSLPRSTVVESGCCHNNKACSVSQPNVALTSCAEIRYKVELAYIQVGGDAGSSCMLSRSADPQLLSPTSGSQSRTVHTKSSGRGQVQTSTSLVHPLVVSPSAHHTQNSGNLTIPLHLIRPHHDDLHLSLRSLSQAGTALHCSSHRTRLETDVPSPSASHTGDAHGNTYWTFSPSLPVSSGGHRENETTTVEESAFLKLTHFVFNQFPDSMGSIPTFQDKPLGPGQEEFVARKKRSPLRPFHWSGPMRQSTEFINHILSERISAGHSSALPFTLPRKSFYRADEDTLHCKTATVNSSLARLLTRNPSDVRSSISGKDLAQLEEALQYLHSIQNFQFWIFGAVSRLLSDSAPDRDLLMNQAVYSMQLAM